jgi:hypothetical protein
MRSARWPALLMPAKAMRVPGIAVAGRAMMEFSASKSQG